MQKVKTFGYTSYSLISVMVLNRSLQYIPSYFDLSFPIWVGRNPVQAGPPQSSLLSAVFLMLHFPGCDTLLPAHIMLSFLQSW